MFWSEENGLSDGAAGNSQYTVLTGYGVSRGNVGPGVGTGVPGFGVGTGSGVGTGVGGLIGMQIKCAQIVAKTCNTGAVHSKVWLLTG